MGIAVLCLGSSLARAQPADPPSTLPPGAAPVQPAPPPRDVDEGVLSDANAARGWMAPTGLTEPGGTWSVSDYELFLVSIGYALTDRASISVTTIPPLTTDFPLWLLFNAKLQVLKAGRLRAAVQGAATYYSIKNSDTRDSFTAFEAGGALTLCLDDACHSHLSGFVGAGFARDTASSVPFVAAGTLVARVGKHVKLVAELDSAFIAGKVNDVVDGALAWYGIRFTSAMIGVDLGFVRPIGLTGNTLLLGIPIVTFSYRNID